jgi:Zn-dependent M28 family amino/carboxypeptidase
LGAYGFFIAPLFYGLSILTHLPFLAWIGLIPFISHLPGWFTGVTADLGPYSPGANDNASAVGTLLALAEHLRQSPLEHTEVWLAFTGCEETGCEGMLALVNEYGPLLKGALFVNLEDVGIGERLIYLRSEGVLRPRRIQPRVEQLIVEAASEQGVSVQPLHTAGLGAFTETGVAWKYGFEGVCLMNLRKDSLWPPEWHRMTDQADRLQPEALERMHRFVWQLLRKVDVSLP